MEMIKKILRERVSGLFLLIFAGLIIGGVSLNSHEAESKIGQNSAVSNQTLNEKKVLGEEINSQEEIMNVSEEINQDAEENDEKIDWKGRSEEKTKEDKTDKDKIETEAENEYYKDLRDRLKKYCDKNYNVKKCKDYLVETKDAFKRGVRFKDLYKKYHFEKKEEEKFDNNISSNVSNNVKTTLIIKLDGNSKSYDIESAKGISVLGLMRQGSISFDILSDGRIDNVGGEKKESGNMSWMLYACKSDTCKMSPVGASEFKIDGYDKIEWRYLDWMTMTGDDWNAW